MVKTFSARRKFMAVLIENVLKKHDQQKFKLRCDLKQTFDKEKLIHASARLTLKELGK